jgi:hypothetical protein
MRSTRGFVGALGAGGSLIAAMVLALVVGSALVAQHGWPGVDPPVRAVELFSDGSVPSPLHHVRSAELRVPAAAFAAPVHRTRLLASARPLFVRAVSSSPALSKPAIGHRKHLIPITVHASPQAGAAKPAPDTAPPATSSPTAGQLVQHAGQALSGTVGTVSPQAGQAVGQLTGAVAGTVDSTTQAVGAATNAVLQTAAPATQAVNNVVNTVTGLLSGQPQGPS